MGQLSLDKTFLLAAYVEAVVYGFFFCIFGSTMLLCFTRGTSRQRDVHGNIMIAISAVMFFFATFHMIMNAYRLLRGYVDHASTPGGPVTFIGNLRQWDHILKDTLYATQENLGSAAAIYRCWVLWSKDWRVIVLPIILLIVNLIAGYTVCGLYASVSPTATVFAARLQQWIKTFYSIAVVLNIICTGLMIYRIWSTHQKSAAYSAGHRKLLYVVRILVESAALQLLVEIVLLTLYCFDINAQYILLESVTSIVGITFNAITIRLKLHAMADSTIVTSQSTHPMHTFGSLPMRRVKVEISKDVEQHDDSYQKSQDTSTITC